MKSVLKAHKGGTQRQRHMVWWSEKVISKPQIAGIEDTNGGKGGGGVKLHHPLWSSSFIISYIKKILFLSICLYIQYVHYCAAWFLFLNSRSPRFGHSCSWQSTYVMYIKAHKSEASPRGEISLFYPADEKPEARKLQKKLGPQAASLETLTVSLKPGFFFLPSKSFVSTKILSQARHSIPWHVFFNFICEYRTYSSVFLQNYLKEKTASLDPSQ